MIYLSNQNLNDFGATPNNPPPGVTTKEINALKNGSEEQADALAQLRQSIGLNFVDANFISSFDNARRLGSDNINFFIKGIPYVFMTCPVLNLCKTNVMSDSFLTYMATSTDENKEILRHLTHKDFVDEDMYSGLSSSNKLIPLVTNTAISVDIKDTVARTKEVGETFYGYKQVHPGSLVDSIVGDEISIKYLELADLPILKMHKVWQDYIEKVRRGSFLPSRQALADGFIDYMSSIYYILCDFDGETIKYWAKYTGVAPLNVPYSSLGGDFNSHEIPDITINYSYCYKEDMSVSILRDFNRITLGNNEEGIANLVWGVNNVAEPGGSGKSDSIINKSNSSTAYPWIVNAPSSTGMGYIFKLKFPNSTESTTVNGIANPSKNNNTSNTGISGNNKLPN